MRYLEVEQKQSALEGTALGPRDGGLPVAAVAVQGRGLDALRGVGLQCLQLAAQPSVSPRVFFYRGCALE